MTRVRIPPPHPFKGGILTRRILILLLVASLCFAVFTIGVSAADSNPSVTAVFDVKQERQYPWVSASISLGESVSSLYKYSRLTALSASFTEPGSLAFTIYGAGGSTVSGDGVSYTVTGSALIVSVVASHAGVVSISVDPGSGEKATASLGLNSWIPGPGGGGGDDPQVDPSWTLGNDFGDWRPGLAVPNQTSTSTQWKTYSENIGE